MKFLVDMNLSPLWPEAFAAVDLFCVHWSAIGKANTSDPEIMAYAKQHEFTVLTGDLDFGKRLAFTRDSKPSVVQLRFRDYRPKAIRSRVLLIISQLSSELAGGALVTIDEQRTRLRLLPFREPN